MAIATIHPIKTTLRVALYYICDYNKTDGKTLVSSYGCAPETADIEFGITQKIAAYQCDQNVLARHLIQSFLPGEIKAEDAHKLGRELADNLLHGEYEYVIATHIDKGHIHNHMIFNNVNMSTGLRYRSNKYSYHEIMKINDSICKENGLSIIENPTPKNKGRYEYEQQKRGGSWKDKLKSSLDKSISSAHNFDEFLQLMTAAGYEVKQGKHIAFRAPGQERFTRAKTLGEDYTEDRIKLRIGQPQQRKKRNTVYKCSITKINLIIDLKAHSIVKTRAYQHWAQKRNILNIANTINFLTANNIQSYSQLESAVKNTELSLHASRVKIVDIETKLNDMNLLLNHCIKYKKLLPIAQQFKSLSQNKRAEFEKVHGAELMIFNAAQNELKRREIKRLPDIGELKKEITELQLKKDTMYADYHGFQKKFKNIKNAHENAKNILCSDREGREKNLHL